MINLGFSDKLVNPSAKTLWENSLSKNDRVLVTGSTGWFGQTTMHLMRGLEDIPVLALASKSRFFESLGLFYNVEKWDEELVNDFEPTVIIDCAFLTREHASEDDLESYICANNDLTAQLMILTKLPSVNRVISISSGAAIFPVDALEGTVEDNPYGFLKRQSEKALQEVSQKSNTNAVIARAWSVSGALIGKPELFAFSDMIISAVRGEIRIKSPNDVFRRYVSVEDLLALSLAQSREFSFDVIDSEGPLVEMNDLALSISKEINKNSVISRDKSYGEKPNLYFSETNRWPELCNRWGLAPEPLDQQILRTYLGLRKSGTLS